MKIVISLLLILASAHLVAAGLDLRKIQSPVLDAQTSANSVAPKFVAFIGEHNSKPKMPGVNSEQRQELKKKLTKQDLQDNYRLERYCTRYNRHLLNLLGL